MTNFRHFPGKIFLTAGLLETGLLLTALDPGGTTVDFNLLKGPAETKSGEENLLKDGGFENPQIDFNKRGSSWRSGCWVWNRNLKDKSHRKRITDGMVRVLEAGSGVNGSRCAMIHTPDELQKEQNKDGNPWMNSSIVQTVALPDSEQPVKYTLNFKVKGKTGKSPGLNSFRVFVNFHDGLPGGRNAKKLRKEINQAISLTADYELRSVSFVAPPHTRRLGISFTLYGQGKIYLDDAILTKTPVSEKVNVFVSPWSFLDNTYCIGEKQPGVIVFEMQNEQRNKFKDLTLTLTIPAGFRFHSAHRLCRPVKSTVNPDGTTSVVCGIQSFRGFIPSEGIYMWNSPSITVIPDHPASDKLYGLTYQISDGDWKGTPRTLNLKVIEPLQGKRPKYFISGPSMVYEFDRAEDQIGPHLDFLVRSGINAISGGGAGLKKAVKKAGITRYGEHYLLSNGFRIGGPKNRTPESYFRTMDGKPFMRGKNYYTCPVEVYKRGKFYRTEVLKMLEKILTVQDSIDHFMPNWEPYYLDYKGCFCDRCREEFVEYMNGKAKAEDIRASWPKKILDNYKTDWVRFRSRQHGMLCATLEQDINAIGRKAGKDSHFIPEVDEAYFTEKGMRGAAQYSALDYMRNLPWINAWGPYIFSNFTQKYQYRPGIHLVTYAAGEENKAFMRSQIKDPARRPKLLAMPNSFQCGTWVTEPEAFAFEVLCYFVNRWEGVIGYFFPRGYDHRYWNAYAKANRAIAEHEEIVLKGGETNQVSFNPATPLPKPLIAAGWKHALPSLADREIYQYRGYRKENEIAAALGNFWQKGELFAVMKVNGLAENDKYAVDSSEGYSLGSFSGAELGKGILVHAGALRWNFFRIRPGDTCHGKLIPQKTMRSEMEKRLPAIRKAADWEKEFAAKTEAEMRDNDPVNDFKLVKEVSSNSVTLKAVHEKGQDYLEIAFPKGRILLDPAKGGSLTSMKIKGRELVHDFGFGMAGFWSPRPVSHLVGKGYLIKNITKTAQGIEVVLSHSITSMEKPELDQLKIVKTFLFTPDGVNVKTALTNGAFIPRKFAFRYHNVPSHLAVSDGLADFGGVHFERNQSLKILRFGAPDAEIDKAHRVGSFLDGKTQTFTLCRQGYPDLTVSMDGSPAYGVIFWDAGTFSTVEPVFRTFSLAPDTSKDFIMKIKW